MTFPSFPMHQSKLLLLTPFSCHSLHCFSAFYLDMGCMPTVFLQSCLNAGDTRADEITGCVFDLKAVQNRKSLFFPEQHPALRLSNLIRAWLSHKKSLRKAGLNRWVQQHIVHLTFLWAVAMGSVFKEQGLNQSRFMPHTGNSSFLRKNCNSPVQITNAHGCTMHDALSFILSKGLTN